MKEMNEQIMITNICKAWGEKKEKGFDQSMDVADSCIIRFYLIFSCFPRRRSIYRQKGRVVMIKIESESGDDQDRKGQQ